MIFSCDKRNHKKLYSEYIMCSNCGFLCKEEVMFIKTYKHTGICLCSGCAKELANEINEQNRKEDTK